MLNLHNTNNAVQHFDFAINTYGIDIVKVTFNFLELESEG